MEPYGTILVDPPWPERGGGKIKRGADRHYSVLTRKGRSFTSLRTARRDLDGVVDAPRRGHSVKPREAIKLIEARSLGPYLEMFARERRPGWDCWGNEAPSGKM